MTELRKKELKDFATAWMGFFTAMAAALSIFGCQHIPGGSTLGISIGIGQPPTYKQAQDIRRVDNDRVLINGTPVDPKDFPAVVRIFSGGSSCTAAVVGPRKVLTAAHCAETGSVVTFTTVSGKKYSGKAVRNPEYPALDKDHAIIEVSQDIDVKPLVVRTERFETKGMEVTLIGYGCINPGGGGGNDGILRTGKSKVEAGQGFDLVLATPDGAALCYGDSGGPTLVRKDSGVFDVIAVNSKGNIKDKSFVTRTTIPETSGWLKSIPGICGASLDCSGQAPPAPKKFIYQGSEIDRVEVYVK